MNARYARADHQSNDKSLDNFFLKKKSNKKYIVRTYIVAFEFSFQSVASVENEINQHGGDWNGSIVRQRDQIPVIKEEVYPLARCPIPNQCEQRVQDQIQHDKDHMDRNEGLTHQKEFDNAHLKREG